MFQWSEKGKINSKMLLKNKKYNSDFSKSIFFLIIITIAGFIIRINYLPENIPLILDSLRYFLLGIDISILGDLPIGYDKTNTGWSLLLSVIFQVFRFESYIDYMMIQRICSILFSALTVIPVYFLTKKFFNQNLAMIGASFFTFSPYIIENSLLGITDSLFIFSVAIFLSLFFSDKKNNVILSFVVLGISSLIRYESLLLIIPTTIIFWHKYKSDIKFRKFYFIGLLLFISTIIPMMLWKIQKGMPDGIFSHVLGGADVVINQGSINSETTKFNLVLGIMNLPEYVGVLLLPLCFIFVPYSIISLIKKENTVFRYLVVLGIFSLIPALYAYGRGIEEVRYVFVVLPVLIIASLFLIEKIVLKIRKINTLTIIFIALIIASSVFYLDFRQPDYEYEREAIEVARFVSELPGKINDYGPESYYVEVMDLEKYEFPILSSDIQFQKKVVNISEESIDDILSNSKNKQISYFAVTESSIKDNQILKEIFYEEKFSYFSKIYDSKDNLSEFNVKIFKINFD